MKYILAAIAALTLSVNSFADTLQEGYEAVRNGNPEQGHAILQPLAEQGNADAQYAVAVLYREGWGVEKSLETAAGYYQKSAEQDHRDAMFEMGWLYQVGEGGLVKDYAKSAMWYQKSAEKGHPAAMYGIASLYYNGMGVERDTDLAMAWYQSSAIAGYPPAQKFLDEVNKASSMQP
ncbi:MAG: tetratricopeptide repeat protein [Gammaproteobacteria bacterium]|jgi:TPR repeat protein